MEQAENDFLHLEAASPRSLIQPGRKLMVLAMVLSDITGILSAVLLAGVLRRLFLGTLTLDSYLWVPAYLVVFILSAFLRDLYPATGLSAVEQFRNITINTCILTLFTIAGTYFIKISEEFSRLLLGLTWLVSLVSVPFIRTIIRHLMVRAGLWGEPVAIIGGAPEVQSLTSYISHYPKTGLKPEANITLPGRVIDLTAEQREHIIQRARKLNEFSRIRIALVAYEQMGELVATREIFTDLFERVVLVNSTDFGTDLGGVTLRQYGGMHTFEVRHTLMDRSAQFQKRAINFIGAGLGLVVLFPLFGIISLLIALDSSGGVFYRQRRLGKLGVEFGMLKFRTMYKDADELLSSTLQQDPERRAQWDCYQKLNDDPRITRVGRFLRRFSLDELPQLWNVLLGEMSIVGPRPIMVNQREMYGANFQHYLRVVPGITGLWQISGLILTTFAQRTEFDVEYVMNWSNWLDVYILVRTLWVVLRRDGAS